MEAGGQVIPPSMEANGAGLRVYLPADEDHRVDGVEGGAHGLPAGRGTGPIPPRYTVRRDDLVSDHRPVDGDRLGHLVADLIDGPSVRNVVAGTCQRLVDRALSGRRTPTYSEGVVPRRIRHREGDHAGDVEEIDHGRSGDVSGSIACDGGEHREVPRPSDPTAIESEIDDRDQGLWISRRDEPQGALAFEQRLRDEE